MTNTPAAIEFRHVSISFEDKRALDDLSFRLERGQMICITGVSGSGKSILLRVASGLSAPDAGEVLVEGREITALDEQELLALRSASMGIMFQEQSLFTGMSVYDNTAYRLDEHGWREEDTERAVREILRFVGLEEEVDKFPEELSVGMGRRLEFARALVGWPKIMLFDEATAGLDPINARSMLDLVIRARDIHQISCLFVTKELHEIPYLETHFAVKHESGEISIEPIPYSYDLPEREPARRLKVMVLDQGRPVFFGTPAEFESSDLPQVTHMTHPVSSAPGTGTYIPDPWARKHPIKKGRS
jgi:ABC-type transporter Mla maintaining outer membrane lipid asymmetry ATPase subunit MlaF